MQVTLFNLHDSAFTTPYGGISIFTSYLVRVGRRRRRRDRR